MKITMVQDRIIAGIGLKRAGTAFMIETRLGKQLIEQGFATETKAAKKKTMVEETPEGESK